MSDLRIQSAIDNGDWSKDNEKLKIIDDQFEMMFGKSMEYLKQECNNLQKEKKDNDQDDK